MHRSAWPSSSEYVGAVGDAAVIDDVASVLSGIRKAKSEAKVSMRVDVASAIVSGDPDAVARVRTASGDLSAAGRIAELTFADSEGLLRVEVTLAEQPE